MGTGEEGCKSMRHVAISKRVDDIPRMLLKLVVCTQNPLSVSRHSVI